MSKEILPDQKQVFVLPETRPEELNDVVEAVRIDCQLAAVEYLSESVVPHGGE